MYFITLTTRALSFQCEIASNISIVVDLQHCILQILQIKLKRKIRDMKKLAVYLYLVVGGKSGPRTLFLIR